MSVVKFLEAFFFFASHPNKFLLSGLFTEETFQARSEMGNITNFMSIRINTEKKKSTKSQFSGCVCEEEPHQQAFNWSQLRGRSAAEERGVLEVKV